MGGQNVPGTSCLGVGPRKRGTTTASARFARQHRHDGLMQSYEAVPPSKGGSTLLFEGPHQEIECVESND